MPIDDLQPTQPYDKSDNEGGVLSYNPKQSQQFLERRNKNKGQKKSFGDLKEAEYEDTTVREIPTFDQNNIRKYEAGYIYDNDGNKFDYETKQFAGYDPDVKAEVESQKLFNTIEIKPEKQGEYEQISEGLKNLYQNGALSFSAQNDLFSVTEKGAQLNELRNRQKEVYKKIVDLSNSSLKTDNPLDFQQQLTKTTNELEKLRTQYLAQENIDKLTKRKSEMDAKLSGEFINFMSNENYVVSDDFNETVKQRANLNELITTLNQANEFVKYGKYLNTRNFAENVVNGLQSFGKTIASQLKGVGLLNYYLFAGNVVNGKHVPIEQETWTGIADGLDKIANSFDDKLYRENFYSSISQGVGSTLGFLASNLAFSALTGGSSTAGTLGTMFSGAMANGSDAYYEAKQKGLSEKDAIISGLLNGIAGTSEAVGVDGMLKTLNHVAGKEGFAGFMKRVAQQSFIGGIEEGSQEAFQKFFGNLVDYMVLNEKVDITEGLADTFKSSFTVGFLMGGVHSAIDKTGETLKQKYVDFKTKQDLVDKIKENTSQFRADVFEQMRQNLQRDLQPEEQQLLNSYVDQFAKEVNSKGLDGADAKTILNSLPENNIADDIDVKRFDDEASWQAEDEIMDKYPDGYSQEKQNKFEHDAWTYRRLAEATKTSYSEGIANNKTQVGIDGLLEQNVSVDLNAPNFKFLTSLVKAGEGVEDIAYYEPETGQITFVVDNVAKKIREIQSFNSNVTGTEIINRIIQHEVVHGLTENKTASFEAIKETGQPIAGIYLSEEDKSDLTVLDTILEDVRKDFKTEEGYTYYGLENLSEFQAELKSNPFFRRMLEKRPALMPEFKNLWEQIKYYLTKIADRIFKTNENNINKFNIAEKSANLLEQADAHTDNLISRFKQEDFHSEVQAYAIDAFNKRAKSAEQILSRRNIEIPANHEHQFEPKKVVKYEKIDYGRYKSNGYEVSTKGDKRFSALNARLNDGRTIEEAYQLDVKGYRKQGNDWRLGKGKPPLIEMSKEELYQKYKELWRQWANENKSIMLGLANHLQEKGITTLTDMFANSPISQARAISELINEFNERRAKTQLKDELLGGAINEDTLKDYQKGKELVKNIKNIVEVNKQQITERQVDVQPELTTQDRDNLPDNINIGNSLGSFVNNIKNEDGTQIFRNNSELLSFGKQFVSLGDVSGLIAFEKALATRLKTTVGGLYSMFEKQTIQNDNQRTFTEDLYAKIKSSTKKNVVVVDKTGFNFSVQQVTTDSYKNADNIYTSVISRKALYEVLKEQIQEKTGLNLHFVEIGYYQNDKGTEKFGNFNQTNYDWKDYKRNLLVNGYLIIPSENEHIAIDLRKSTDSQNRVFNIGRLLEATNSIWDVTRNFDNAAIFHKAMEYVTQSAPEFFTAELAENYVPDNKNKDKAKNLFGQTTVQDILNNKIQYNTNDKTEKNLIAVTKANVYLDILYSFAYRNLFSNNVFPSLANEQAKQFKRINNVFGEASQAFLSQGLFKQLINNEPKKDALWIENNQIMSRDVVLDTKTLPKQIQDYFNSINIGDGSVIVSQEKQNVFNDLNGIPLNKRGYASKSKQVGIDMLHKNAWHIATPYSPINKYLFYNKIGAIYMDTAVKVDTRQVTMITWDDLMNNKTPSDNHIVINNMMNDSHIKSTGVKNTTVGGLSSAMIRTGFLGLIKPAEKEVFIENASRIVNNLSQYISDISQNPSKYVKELVLFAKQNSFDSSTRRFILQNLDTANNPNPLLGLGYLYSVVDYFLAGRLPEKFFNAMTLRQDGVYPTLTPDLGNASAWRDYLIGSNQLTEEETKQYFNRVAGQYWLKDGYCITSADLGFKKGDNALNSVIPPAGVQDMRAMQVIGVIRNAKVSSNATGEDVVINKNTVIVPNQQFVKNSGKDFDIDQTAIIPVKSNDTLNKMFDIVKEFNGDAKMQSYLDEFVGKINPEKLNDVILDDSYWRKRQSYWQQQIPDIKVDLAFAKMLDLFGKNPKYTQINFSNPIFLDTAFENLRSDIGVVFNLGVLHTAMLELENKGFELDDGTQIYLKGRLADQLGVLYELTHYTLDWQSDPKILALGFDSFKFFRQFFSIPSADENGIGVDDIAPVVNDIKNQFLMPLRNIVREPKSDDYRLGLLTVEKALSIARQSLKDGNPFADTFIGKLATKLTDVNFGTLMPSPEKIENIKRQVKSAIRSNNRYNLAFISKSSADVKQFANVFNRLVNAPNKRNLIRLTTSLNPLIETVNKTDDIYITTFGVGIRSEKNLRQTGFFETIDNLNQLRELQDELRKKRGNETSLSSVYNDYIIGLLTSGVSATKDGRIGFMNGKGFDHVTNRPIPNEKMNGSLFIIDAKNGIITFEKKTYFNGQLVSSTEPFTSFQEFVKRNPQLIAMMENEKRYGFVSRLFNDFDIQDYYAQIKQKFGSDNAASMYINEMKAKGVNGQGILTFKTDKGRNFTESFVKNRFKEFINSDLFAKQTEADQSLFYALILGVYDPNNNYDYSLAQALGITTQYKALRSSLNYSMAIEGSPLKTVMKQTMKPDGSVTEEKLKATDFSSPLVLMAESETKTAKEFLADNLPIIERIVKNNLNIETLQIPDIAALPEAEKLNSTAKQINISDPTTNDYRKIVENVFSDLEPTSGIDKDTWLDMLTEDILDYTYRKEAELSVGLIPSNRAKSFEEVAKELAQVALKDLNRNNLIFPKALYGKTLIKQRMLQYFGNRNILMSPNEQIFYKLGGQVQYIDLRELTQSFDVFNPVDKPTNVAGSWIAWQMLSRHHDFYADKAAEISNFETEIFKTLEGIGTDVSEKTNIATFPNIIKSKEIQRRVWDIAEGSDKKQMFKNLHIARLRILQDEKGALWVVEEKDIEDSLEYLTTDSNVYFTMRKIKRHDKAVTAGIKGIYEYDENNKLTFTKDEFDQQIATKLKNGNFKFADKSNYLAMWHDTKANKTKLYQLDEKGNFNRSRKKVEKNLVDTKNAFGSKKVLSFLANEILINKELLLENSTVQNKAVNDLRYRTTMTALAMRWGMDAFLPQLTIEHIADLDDMMREAAQLNDIDLRTEALSRLVDIRDKYAQDLEVIGSINKKRMMSTIADKNHRFIMPKVYRSFENYDKTLTRLAQEELIDASTQTYSAVGNKILKTQRLINKERKREKQYYEATKDTVTGAKTLPLHREKNYEMGIEHVGQYISGIASKMRHDALELRALLNEKFLTKENNFIRHEMNFTTALLLGQDFMWISLKNNQKVKPNNGIRFLLKKDTIIPEWSTPIEEYKVPIDMIYYATVLKTEPFFYTVKIIGAPDNKTSELRINDKQMHNKRTTVGTSFLKKLEVKARELTGKDLGTVALNDFINAFAKYKIKASTYALLNLKPYYSLRNRIGGSLMNHSLFTKQQIKNANSWVEDFAKFKNNPEAINNEIQKEYFELLTNEVSAIFGGLNELMGKFGNIIRTSKDLLTPEFVKMASESQIDWENTRPELEAILKQLQNKEGKNPTNSNVTKLQTFMGKLRIAYAKNALYNVPFGVMSKAGMITENQGLGKFANPNTTEEENRNATVFVTAMACMDIFGDNNVDLDNAANLQLYKETVKRFTLNQTQQNTKNSQFLYRQALDLSHIDSTVLGRASITQFGHYTNSLESAAANRMRNIFRIADEFGWTRALSFQDGKYNAVYKNPYTGHEIILPTPIFSQSRQFNKMISFGLIMSLAKRASRSLKYIMLAAGLNAYMLRFYDLMESFYINNLNDSLTINILDGLTSGFLTFIGAAFLDYEPKPDDKKKKTGYYLRQSYRHIFGFNEQDYIKFQKTALQNKYGKSAARQPSDSDLRVDYYTKIMKDTGMPLMFFVPQGVGSNLATDLASQEIAYSLFKSVYDEALVPDSLLMQAGVGTLQTIVPFGYILNPIGRMYYNQFLARSTTEKKIFKYKSEHSK